MPADYIPDYTDLFDQHEAEQQRRIDRLPKCDCCDEPVTDEYFYEINSDVICEECLKTHFRKLVDDYIE